MNLVIGTRHGGQAVEREDVKRETWAGHWSVWSLSGSANFM